MEYAILGWPPDGPTLDLDHERFSYAGKFVRSATGKAVAQDGGEILAAAAFNEDRGAPDALRVRTITVRRDRRGEGVGPRLLRLIVTRALNAGDQSRTAEEPHYERVRIAVNNPFAYQAAYRAGFAYTGTETGLAEHVLEAPGDRGPDPYHEGLAAFAEADPTPDERAFVDAHRSRDPPETVPCPVSGDAE